MILSTHYAYFMRIYLKDDCKLQKVAASGVEPEPRALPCPSTVDGMLRILHCNVLCDTALFPHCLQQPLTTPARVVTHVPLLHKMLSRPMLRFLCICFSTYRLLFFNPFNAFMGGANVGSKPERILHYGSPCGWVRLTHLIIRRITVFRFSVPWRYRLSHNHPPGCDTLADTTLNF